MYCANKKMRMNRHKSVYIPKGSELYKRVSNLKMVSSVGDFKDEDHFEIVTGLTKSAQFALGEHYFNAEVARLEAEEEVSREPQNEPQNEPPKDDKPE